MKTKKIFIFILLIILILINTISFADSSMPQITAEAAILMDESSGKILYEKNIEQKMYPASTTKILTAILAIESCNLNDVVTVSYDAIRTIPAGYAVSPLQVGEELTVDQLLKLMMVHSANDAANAIAFYMDGSIEAFANRMNAKLEEIGLKNTHFTNPSGIHDPNHYSTAKDLALLMQYCMKDSTFRSYAGLKNCIIPATNKYEQRVFSTTNDLLINDSRNVASNYYYPYAIAGKTGYTTEANNCLIAVSNKDGLEFISVVLGVGVYSDGLSGKFSETKSLFEYGYQNYTIQKIREKGAIATQIEISNATDETKNLDLCLKDDITALVKQSEINQEILPQITLIDNPLAPIAEGQVLGSITYYIDGVAYSSDLLASHNVEVSSFWVLAVQIFLIFVIVLLLYLLLSSEKKIKFGKFYRK